MILINMGRRLVPDNEKKVKLAVSIDPWIILHLKDKHINLSSLVNKLLINFIKNGNQSL
jgi:hypothetical protein